MQDGISGRPDRGYPPLSDHEPPHGIKMSMQWSLRYHDHPKNPIMVFMTGADFWSKNTMKNTIDDADHIVNFRYFIIIYQYVMNSFYSHSMVNKPFLSFIFKGLFSR